MATTAFMGLELPTPTVTIGPDWATELNTAIETIDSHDHSSGKGNSIKTSGLNINADLTFNSNALLDLSTVQFIDSGSTLTGTTNRLKMYTVSGDLYYTNDLGSAVQITDGGSIVTSPGVVNSFEITSVNTNLVISPAATFVFLIVDTTAARAITLPLAGSVSSGRFFIIKDKDNNALVNNITVNVSGSDTIDGGSSYIIDSSLGSTMIIGDGALSWYVS